MKDSAPQFPVPPVALDGEGAAAALSISHSTFKRYVQPQLRCCRIGACRVYPVADLAAYADKKATLAGGAR
jgi:hypothetical protein